MRPGGWAVRTTPAAKETAGEGKNGRMGDSGNCMVGCLWLQYVFSQLIFDV